VRAGTSLLQRFPDGEQDVEIQTSLRGQPIFVVQPLGPPVGENLLELLKFVDPARAISPIETTPSTTLAAAFDAAGREALLVRDPSIVPALPSVQSSET
jgi:hypothetical protein